MKCSWILLFFVPIAICSLSQKPLPISHSICQNLDGLFAIHKGTLIIYDFTKVDGLLCSFYYQGNALKATAVVFQRCPEIMLPKLQNFVNSDIGITFLDLMLEPDLVKAYWMGRKLDTLCCDPDHDSFKKILEDLGQQVLIANESCKYNEVTGHTDALKVLFIHAFVGSLFVHKRKSLCLWPVVGMPQQMDAYDPNSFLQICLFSERWQNLRTLETVLNTSFYAFPVGTFIRMMSKTNVRMAHFAAALLSISTYRMKPIFWAIKALLSKNKEASELLKGMERYATILDHGAEICEPQVLTGIRIGRFKSIRDILIKGYRDCGPCPPSQLKILYSPNYN